MWKKEEEKWPDVHLKMHVCLVKNWLLFPFVEKDINYLRHLYAQHITLKISSHMFSVESATQKERTIEAVVVSLKEALASLLAPSL